MMSATTTEILFNSPALHSLKRDQLVKLCKIHSLKASGKNVEMIARLKAVAETLPKDSALSIAARSEEEPDEVDADGDQRMGTIEELGGSSSQGTLASHRSGEFGTTSSKGTMSAASSVGSSIKALASSFGLKRSTTTKSTFSTVSSTSTLPPLPVFAKPANYPTNDDLSLYSKPYSSIPEASPSSKPKLDNFAPDNIPSAEALSKFDFTNSEDVEPLPGHVLRPGAPAPLNARLSLGQTPATPGKRKSGNTTTIRLVSNPTSDTDELPTSLNWGTSNFGPSTPQLKPFKPTFDLLVGSPSTNGQRIYPALPMDDLVYGHTATTSTMNAQPVPGGLSAASTSNPPTSALSPPVGPKFIFGSPDPRKRPSVTNAEFSATASSVLDEINKRLQQEGVNTISNTIVNDYRSGKTNEDGSPRTVKPLPKGRGDITKKFDKMHEKEFAKMQSILPNHRAAPTASTEAPHVGRKRKSSVLGPPEETSHTAYKKPKAVLPGGFGDDDDEDEDQGEQSRKKARVEFADDGNNDGNAEEEERLKVERDAIRKKLAMNREKRRSSGRHSVGRRSTGPRRSSAARLHKVPPKAAAKSRFGFGFVSNAAKTLVRGVWGGSKKEKPTTQIAVSTTTTTSTAAPSTSSTSNTTVKPPVRGSIGSMGPPPVQRNPSSGAKPTVTKRVVSGTVSSMGALSSASSSRTSTAASSRAPIPSSLRNGNTPIEAANAKSGTTSSRTSVVHPAGRPSGSTRGSITQHPALGSTKSRASGTSFLPGTAGSRLLAPTASSLAKAQGSVNKLRQVAPVPQTKPTSPTSPMSPTSPRSRIFDSLTNSDVLGSGSKLPSTPGKIFSKPLVVPPGSGIPSPVRSNGANPTTTITPAAAPTRQRSVNGRKPRISRSKVIARLASQRVASTSSTTSGAATGTAGSAAAPARSSLGPRVGVPPPRKSTGARRSHVGAAGGTKREARESAVMMSAKKRVRQSEYSRRKSRASAAIGGGGAKMDVD